ncbi:hypothetical protein GOODEAATRI_027982 [Goodea atripinnis]|uniref:Uncharacterized protein n=1 Tax=Goodea atripinnis TaxID=208336 RepID=A0ABV0NE93_9TELE
MGVCQDSHPSLSASTSGWILDLEFFAGFGTPGKAPIHMGGREAPEVSRQKLGWRADFQYIATKKLLCYVRIPDPESGHLDFPWHTPFRAFGHTYNLVVL